MVSFSITYELEEKMNIFLLLLTLLILAFWLFLESIKWKAKRLTKLPTCSKSVPAEIRMEIEREREIQIAEAFPFLTSLNIRWIYNYIRKNLR